MIPASALFDFDSDRLRAEAAETLVRQLAEPVRHADLSRIIEVRGHTDARGSDAYNMDLSSRRAWAVEDLLERSFPELHGHLVPVARGEHEPVAPNELGGRDNPEGRALNRRVEIDLDVIESD